MTTPVLAPDETGHRAGGPMAVPRRLAVGVLRLYQICWSQFRPPACRFTPSCSAYAVTAIDRFGVTRGGWLALRRLSRCHPYHRGGHDPVPSKVDRNGESDKTGDAEDNGGTHTSSPAGVPRCHTC